MRMTAFAAIFALTMTGGAQPLTPPSAATQQRVLPPVGREFDADRICAPFLAAEAGGSGGPVIGRTASPGAPAPSVPQAGAIVVTGTRVHSPNLTSVAPPSASVSASRIARRQGAPQERERYNGEEVAAIQAVADAPVSTFSVDVDTGSYANVRRFLRDGRMPPQAAVRTEEMLNYFRYDYPRPADRARPFTVSTEVTSTPWNPVTRLLRIGLRGYDLARSDRPAANLVFLVDVSGSMESRDKLPLVQCSLALLAEQLGPRDRVSIVVYAGAAGQVLAPTSDRGRILEALSRLRAGGSTAGAAGLELAYRTARESRVEGGINRVVLATDGDFNVGVSNTDALIDMIEREREGGVQLTTLGFGTGNYNEAMMEQVADHGNCNYAYIDNPREAEKVLRDELASTLFTIAHDVKIQVEFNPAHICEYRLIGYENRALRAQDFANDAVDAGEIGAGHQVTALYEIAPAGSRGWLPERRYDPNRRSSAGHGGEELAHVRLRYKLPGEERSRLIERELPASVVRMARAPTGDGAFAAAVAAYGQLLRGDDQLGRFSFADVRALAARGGARDEWRREFIRLAEVAEQQIRRSAGR